MYACRIFHVVYMTELLLQLPVRRKLLILMKLIIFMKVCIYNCVHYKSVGSMYHLYGASYVYSVSVHMIYLHVLYIYVCTQLSCNLQSAHNDDVYIMYMKNVCIIIIACIAFYIHFMTEFLLQLVVRSKLLILMKLIIFMKVPYGIKILHGIY